MSKKFLLVAQVFMPFIMAAIMSAVMGLIAAGPTLEWLANWPISFVIAWPIAFLLTMVAWPVSLTLATLVSKPRSAE